MEDRFIYGTVYPANIWINKAGENVTVCRKCNTGFKLLTKEEKCPDCECNAGDAHGDFADNQEVEKMCWGLMTSIIDENTELIEKSGNLIKSIISKESNLNITDLVKTLNSKKHYLGFAHSLFDPRLGYIVENHIQREQVEILGEKFNKNTWKAGFIVHESIFEKAKNKEIVGFSFGGKGVRTPVFEEQNG